MDLTDDQWHIIIEMVGDAYAYRVGDNDLDDDDMEPIDRDAALRYRRFADDTGITDEVEW